MNFTARPNPADQAAIKRALEAMPLEVQDRAMKGALRRFGNQVKRGAASLTPVNTGDLRRDLSVKVKAYGTTAWSAVGHKLRRVAPGVSPKGRALRRAYGGGWRSHFTEYGFHQWSPGWSRRNPRGGRGWRKGQYHRGRGVLLRGRPALTTSFKAQAPSFALQLRDDLSAQIREMNG